MVLPISPMGCVSVSVVELVGGGSATNGDTPYILPSEAEGFIEVKEDILESVTRQQLKIMLIKCVPK